MSKPPALFRDLKNYLSGRVIVVLLGVVAFPLLTRMLGVGDYGILSFALRIVLLLTVLSKCGLQYSAARFYKSAGSAEPGTSERVFHSTMLFGPLLTSSLVVGVYLPVIWLLHAQVTDPLLYRCLLLAPAVVVLRSVQSLLMGLLRNEGRSALHSALEVASRSLTLVCIVVLFMGHHHSAFLVLCWTIASESLVLVIQIGTLLRRGLIDPLSVDWSLIARSLSFGIPLIAYELSSIVLDSGDRLLVLRFLGSTALGYYSAAYNVSGYLQDTMMTPLNLAIVPIYMKLWNEEGRLATLTFLSEALSWFVVAACVLVGLTALCSQDAVVLLASSRFAEAHLLLPILIPGLLLYATHIFLNVGLILEKRTGVLAALVAASAASNIGLNVLLIPRMGLMGAAWATLLSYVLLIGALLLVGRRVLPVKLDARLASAAAAASCIAYLPVSLIHTPWHALTLLLRSCSDLSLFAGLLWLLSERFRQLVSALWTKLAETWCVRGSRSPQGPPLLGRHPATEVEGETT